MNPITQTIKERGNNLLIELHARFSSDTYDHTPASVHWDNIDAVIKSHITQSHIALLESVGGVVEKLECPEKCNQGHIFLGYTGEFENEENWDSCPLCVKKDEYVAVISKKDILIELQEALKELKDNK